MLIAATWFPLLGAWQRFSNSKLKATIVALAHGGGDTQNIRDAGKYDILYPTAPGE